MLVDVLKNLSVTHRIHWQFVMMRLTARFFQKLKHLSLYSGSMLI